MKLYFPHTFTLRDAKKDRVIEAGSVADVPDDMAEALKRRFGAVNAADMPGVADNAVIQPTIAPAPAVEPAKA